MSTTRGVAEAVLDEIVCAGVALDVFHADQARLLLEELDGFLERINQTGMGKRFFANLQLILLRDLILGLSRLYEPYSPRNPGRSLPAAARHIATHAAELRVLDRGSLIEFLTRRGESRQAIEQLSGEQLSVALARHLDTHVPRADSGSARPLDQALTHLKAVRDRAIAHHDRVIHSSLLVPGWAQLVELIHSAREIVALVAQAYLSVSYDLASDASQAASSLQRLLKRAGLAQNPGLGGDDVG